MIPIASRTVVSGLWLLAFGAMFGSAFGCGGGEATGVLPLVTIAECEQMDGVPLFDPEDERPLELSCPDGLEAIAEFDEDFYGSSGGVCCQSPDAMAEDAVGDALVPPEGRN